jgi:non-heme chloroperoxidase
MALASQAMPELEIGTGTESAIQLYYEDHGDYRGTTVVLIHGWPLSSRAWENQVGALVDAGHRVIAYDRRGFGRSSQPWSGYDYDTFADDLATLMDSLQLTDAVLVGFSMGGGEVVRYLSRHGASRVAKAVLIGAVPPYLLKTADNPEGGLDEATIAQLKAGVRADRISFLDGFLTNFFSANGKLKVSEAHRRYAHAIASFASAKGTLDCIDAWGRTDFRDDVRNVSVPTLVIHGDADAIVPIEISGKRTAEMIDGARLVVVKGAPHGLTSSHADEVNQLLLDFLT